MMRRRHLLALGVLAPALLLGGCLVPERFEARIEVTPRGAYHVYYEGTVQHYDAATRRGRLGPLLTAEIEHELRHWDRTPGVQTFEALGQGRYRLRSHEQLRPGQRSRIFPDLYFQTVQRGVFELTLADARLSELRQMREIGMPIEGRIAVRLPPNAEVVSDNADRRPGWKVFSDYVWHLDVQGDAPRLRFRLREVPKRESLLFGWWPW